MKNKFENILLNIYKILVENDIKRIALSKKYNRTISSSFLRQNQLIYNKIMNRMNFYIWGLWQDSPILRYSYGYGLNYGHGDKTTIFANNKLNKLEHYFITSFADSKSITISVLKNII